MESINTPTDIVSSLYLKESITLLTNKANIQKWDVGASISSDSSVQVDKGIAKQLKSAQRNSLTIRVWNNDGLVGIASTSDITERGLQVALEAAYQASYFGNPNDIPDFSSEAKSKLPKINRTLCNQLGIKYLFSKLKKAEMDLLLSHNSIKSVPYNGISESNYERVYINSDGAFRSVKRTHASIYLFARTEDLERKPRSSGAIRVASGADQLDIDECIKEASLKTISHLNYEPINTGKYLVCFKPEAFLDLMNAFSNLFNARSILDGLSLSNKDSIGQRLSVPFFNLDDDGLHEKNIGAVPFDGEGTPTRKINLVKDGIITNFIHSEATARTFKVKPTGHAGLGSKVSVGPDWLIISKSRNYKSQGTKYNHKKTMEPFVLIESLSALHAGIKSTQGSFSLPFDGWLVKDGEKISIEAATVAGDIKKLLMNITEIEDEIIITPNGISPHIWVQELSITGEA